MPVPFAAWGRPRLVYTSLQPLFWLLLDPLLHFLPAPSHIHTPHPWTHKVVGPPCQPPSDGQSGHLYRQGEDVGWGGSLWLFHSLRGLRPSVGLCPPTSPNPIGPHENLGEGLASQSYCFRLSADAGRQHCIHQLTFQMWTKYNYTTMRFPRDFFLNESLFLH